MKNLMQTILSKIALCVFFAFLSYSAVAQTAPTVGKDILLYETDFRDWTPMAITNGSDLHAITTGGGAGFSVQGRPNVEPNSTSCGMTGFLWFNQDNNYAITPAFNFVEGGVVEIWYCTNNTSTRNMYVLNANAVGIEGPVPGEDGTPTGRLDRTGVASGTQNGPAVTTYMAVGTNGADRNTIDPAKVGVYHAGNAFVTRSTGALYKVSYRLPAAQFTGMKTVQFGSRDSRILQLKVYSTVGTTPYVASTNYANLINDPNAAPHTMRGTAGGAAYSGVAVNAAVNVKGWNISGDIILSLEGADAGKFSFNDGAGNAVPTLTIPNADAITAAGVPVPLQFSPSSQAGVGSAVLVIADATNPARNYKVALTGITDDGTTNPQLIGSTDVIPFYTSVIEPVSQTYSFAGIYLTADATVSFTGPVAGRLKASKASFSALEAGKGATFTITYTGTPSASLHDETTSFMVITSGGSTLTVPLRLETFDLKPPLHALEFAADPAGTAIIKLSLAGPLYPYGSTVEVTVIPESGYYITGWSDNAGSTSDFRTIRIKPDATTPNLITVKLAPIGTGCNPCNSSGGFTAYIPENVNDDGFRANWSKNPNESSTTVYTVTVYDKAGNAIPGATCTAPAGTYFCDIAGLTPADKSDDANFMFSYKVEASNLLPADPSATPPLSTPVPETDKVGVFRLTGDVDFTCGQ
ncbi:MAG: hypothetical protein LBR81_09365 [Prevotellaceae bacterium]|jgi:hypothetical protein|nr:hypothetical protein [Prevotellaceae bacterium]